MRPWPRNHCQKHGSVCLAGNRDDIACPPDSCDIDDGIRPDPRALCGCVGDYCHTATGGTLGWNLRCQRTADQPSGGETP